MSLPPPRTRRSAKQSSCRCQCVPRGPQSSFGLLRGQRCPIFSGSPWFCKANACGGYQPSGGKGKGKRNRGRNGDKKFPAAFAAGKRWDGGGYVASSPTV